MLAMLIGNDYGSRVRGEACQTLPPVQEACWQDRACIVCGCGVGVLGKLAWDGCAISCVLVLPGRVLPRMAAKVGPCCVFLQQTPEWGGVATATPPQRPHPLHILPCPCRLPPLFILSFYPVRS